MDIFDCLSWFNIGMLPIGLTLLCLGVDYLERNERK